MNIKNYIVTDRSFYKSLLIMALPLAAQNIVSMGVNLVDNIMLGALGETALSASSLANHYISLFQYGMMGISMGSSVLPARFWGASDQHSLKRTVTIALRIAILLAILLSVVTALFPEQIMGLYTHETAVVQGGKEYLLWSIPTFLLSAFSMVCTNILRSIGLGKVPLKASLVAFFVNIGANYVLIFGKLGLPAMGIAGAALGTVIARVLEFGVICGYFFVADTKIGYRIHDIISPCRDLLREYLRISVPVFIQRYAAGCGR